MRLIEQARFLAAQRLPQAGEETAEGLKTGDELSGRWEGRTKNSKSSLYQYGAAQTQSNT